MGHEQKIIINLVAGDRGHIRGKQNKGCAQMEKVTKVQIKNNDLS